MWVIGSGYGSGSGNQSFVTAKFELENGDFVTFGGSSGKSFAGNVVSGATRFAILKITAIYSDESSEVSKRCSINSAGTFLTSDCATWISTAVWAAGSLTVTPIDTYNNLPSCTATAHNTTATNPGLVAYYDFAASTTSSLIFETGTSSGGSTARNFSFSCPGN